MPLIKKEVVQKTYRIDKELEQSLERLSKILNRSQNDLVNYALKLLFIDNEKWFFEDYVKEIATKLVNCNDDSSIYVGDYEFIFQNGRPCHLIIKEMKNKECVTMNSFDIVYEPGMIYEVRRHITHILEKLYEKKPNFIDDYIYKHIEINDVSE